MIRGMNHNIAMNFMTRDYLSLAILKDDPEYRNREIKDGDTVIQRYEAFNEFFKEFLKHWGLNGLWYEHASSNYEYHTYASFFNLADLSPDPVVRQRLAEPPSHSSRGRLLCRARPAARS